MHIRNYTKQDKESIIDLYNTSKLDELKFEKVEFELIPLQADKERNRLIFNSQILVYNDGQTKGFVVFDDQRITGIFVGSEFRGQGIGQSLLRTAIEIINSEVRLQVVASNTPAMELYSSFGFKVATTEIGHYNGQEVLINKMILANYLENIF